MFDVSHVSLPRQDNAAEEIANSVTHGLACCFSVVGAAVLLYLAGTSGETTHLVACAVFGVTMTLLYGTSTLYHGVSKSSLKRILRVCDHISIYLFIAGSYTPFLLIHFDDGFGWALLATVWSIAVAGTIFKLFFTGRFARLSVALYIAMGWLIVLGFERLMEAVPSGCLAWLAAGGLLYTGGVVFFAWKDLPFNHAIWHLFVIAGSICHYIAVVRYIIPQ